MRSPVRQLVLLTFALVAVWGCAEEGDPSGGLDPNISEAPLPGDASGSEHAGAWTLELYYSSCTGVCSFDTILGVASVCDVGETATQIVEATQTDGSIRFEGNGLPSRYDGGVDASGDFDLLGVATQDGGNIEIRVRVQGAFDGDSLAGAARGRTMGTIDDQTINCRYDVEVTGTRG